MIITAAAKRYARALADVAVEPGARQQVQLELDWLGAAIQGHPDLAGAMNNPAVPAEKKLVIIHEVLKVGGQSLSPLTGNLLRLMIANRRMGMLPQIQAAFQAEMDERGGIVSAEVVTRSELDAGKRHLLTARLQQTLGRSMRLRFQRDETIIGGAILRIGSTVYDGSVRCQLEEIRFRLIGDARFHHD